MTPVQLQTLSAELKTDPVGRGYAAMDDETAAKSFRTGDRNVGRDSIDGGLLASCIVRADFATLVAADKDYVRLLCSTATPIPLTPAFKTELRDVFGAGTATRANVIAAIKRSGSRAEELSIPMPTTSDVADARRLP